MSLTKRDLICTESWNDGELIELIKLAKRMKLDPYNQEWRSSLVNKKFLMLFYNPSLRTHLSFEAAVTDLGGNPIHRTSSMDWKKSTGRVASSEALKDVARVVSRYVDGVGIRMSMDAVNRQGEGYEFLLDFAKFADIPVISMADDSFHPCQGLADLMGWAERYSPDLSSADLENLRDKTLLLTWGSSGFARPWASVQSHLLLAARFGMHINLAYPKGYELDPGVIDKVRGYCTRNQKEFQITHDPHAEYDGAEVVYVRNWVSGNAYQQGQFQYETEIAKADNLQEWIVTAEKMARTKSAIFANPMPIDRGREVEDVVADSYNSVVYEVAENRKHVQKALLASLIK